MSIPFSSPTMMSRSTAAIWPEPNCREGLAPVPGAGGAQAQVLEVLRQAVAQPAVVVHDQNAGGHGHLCFDFTPGVYFLHTTAIIWRASRAVNPCAVLQYFLLWNEIRRIFQPGKGEPGRSGLVLASPSLSILQGGEDEKASRSAPRPVAGGCAGFPGRLLQGRRRLGQERQHERLRVQAHEQEAEGHRDRGRVHERDDPLRPVHQGGRRRRGEGARRQGLHDRSHQLGDRAARSRWSRTSSPRRWTGSPWPSWTSPA